MADEVTYLAGGELNDVRPLPPFDDSVCRFLNDFSDRLLKDRSCRDFPDITAVAFWARRGNIERLKQKSADDYARLGKGLAFHITPSNIPVQFIFSYAFGLLAGNANIVRVTSKDYPQIDLMCGILDELLREEKYCDILKMTALIRYPRESSKTAEYSARCQVRLIWGGDATIERIRQNKLPPRSTDITFPDRYSLALINGDAIEGLSDERLNRLAKDFYNDTFLMDQNACSSPQLIMWTGNVAAKEKFWGAVEELAKRRYPLVAAHATEKYAEFCRNAIEFPDTGALNCKDNYLYRVPVKNLFDGIDNLRGKFGLFYECDAEDFAALDGIVNGKYQTLTYFGFDAKDLAATVVKNSWSGIDRIVPIGKALDMTYIWDGYDLINQMTRIIQTE